MEIDELFAIPREKRLLHCAINGLLELFPNGTYQVTIRRKNRDKAVMLDAMVNIEHPRKQKELEKALVESSD